MNKRVSFNARRLAPISTTTTTERSPLLLPSPKVVLPPIGQSDVGIDVSEIHVSMPSGTARTVRYTKLVQDSQTILPEGAWEQLPEIIKANMTPKIAKQLPSDMDFKLFANAVERWLKTLPAIGSDVHLRVNVSIFKRSEPFSLTLQVGKEQFVYQVSKLFEGQISEDKGPKKGPGFVYGRLRCEKFEITGKFSYEHHDFSSWLDVHGERVSLKRPEPIREIGFFRTVVLSNNSFEIELLQGKRIHHNGFEMSGDFKRRGGSELFSNPLIRGTKIYPDGFKEEGTFEFHFGVCEWINSAHTTVKTQSNGTQFLTHWEINAEGTAMVIKEQKMTYPNGQYDLGKFEYSPSRGYELVEGSRGKGYVISHKGRFAFIPELGKVELVEGTKGTSPQYWQKGTFGYLSCGEDSGIFILQGSIKAGDLEEEGGFKHFTQAPTNCYGLCEGVRINSLGRFEGKFDYDPISNSVVLVEGSTKMNLR